MKPIISIKSKLLGTLIVVFLMINGDLLYAQPESLNTQNIDAYSTLRSIVSQASLDNSDAKSSLEYRLNEGHKFYIKYFIGADTFVLKSDIDILNRIIYAKLKFSSAVKPYDYERSKIDSLYLLLDKHGAPIHIYIYNPIEDSYGKVIDQGRYTLVELYNLEIQEGKTNPIIDSGTVEDRLTLKKIPFLIDTGRWYKVPKSKNQLIDFIKQHYSKSISKKSIKSGSPINTLQSIN